MTIRIFIGSSPNAMDLEAEMALEHSIRRWSSMPVEIEFMRQTKEAGSFWSGWDARGWATPFSGFRWAIPERCSFEGLAIYTDVDMLVRGDVADLWRMQIAPGAAMISKQPGSEKFCVCLFDCAKMQKHVWPVAKLRADPGAHRHMRRMFASQPRLVQAFPDSQNWNCLDGENLDAGDPRIKLIHFTHIPTQPHIPLANKRLAAEGRSHWFKGETYRHPRQDLVDLWFADYNAAKAKRAEAA
jgi:hypothetical protein